MKRTSLLPARILTGLLTIAGCALPQAYTISAKPGALSYVEGNVTVNGATVSPSALRAMFLSANDTLVTDAGKAEVLLTPGVFLRVGDDTQVRMIAPSLVDTQIELVAGEMMIEVDQVVAGVTTSVMDHGSSTSLTKTGLYRFTATAQPTVAVLDGKADVYFGDKKIELKKGKQALLTQDLTISKLDLDKADELYAWSNVRAQYDAGVSYQGSKSVYDSGGFGYGSGYQSAGLYWNNPYNSWMWLPGNGAFYSPFGWGFYGPGLVAYAPVVGYGYGYLGGYGYSGGGYYTGASGVVTAVAPKPILGPHPPLVPVNPKSPGIVSSSFVSPAAFAAARLQTQQSMQRTGYQFHTAAGTPAANIANGRSFSNTQAAAHAASASARSASYSGSSNNSSGGSAASSASSGWRANSSAPSSGGSGFGGGGASHSMGGGGSSGGGHSSK